MGKDQFGKGGRGILKPISSRAHVLPATGGTYALLLACPRSRKLRIGRLGERRIPPGWYIYVGSAFGPGGLKSRCLRHLRRLRRLHWHIDYLRPAASLQDIWFSADPVPREHLWAETIAGLPGAGIPIPRFGASDCRCRSHLFHFASKPVLAVFRRRTLQRAPASVPIMAFSAAASRQARRNAL
jgi:Uri superfamily endonuclease